MAWGGGWVKERNSRARLALVHDAAQVLFLRHFAHLMIRIKPTTNVCPTRIIGVIHVHLYHHNHYHPNHLLGVTGTSPAP